MRLITIFLLTFCITLCCHARSLLNSKISISVPSEFNKSQKFNGYEIPEKFCEIKIQKIPTSLNNAIIPFTQKDMLKKSLRIDKSTKLRVNGLNAFLFELTQPAPEGYVEYKKIILALGDDKDSAVIIATYPTRFKNEFYPKMKKALLTTRWDAAQSEKAFKDLNFKYTEGAKFKFSKKDKNKVIFTPNGNLSEDMTDLASITLEVNEIDDKAKANIAKFSKFTLSRNKMLKRMKLVNQKKIKLDKLPAYLIEAKGQSKESDKASMQLQCLIVDENFYYTFTAKDLISNKSKKEFYAILKSFTRKEVEQSKEKTNLPSEDYFYNLSFKFSNTEGLKYGKKVGDGFALTSKSTSLLVKTPSAICLRSKILSSSIKEYAHKQLIKFPHSKEISISAERATKVNGFDAYIIEGYSNNSEKINIVQYVITTKKASYTLYGFANETYNFSAKFHQIFQSFETLEIKKSLPDEKQVQKFKKINAEIKLPEDFKVADEFMMDFKNHKEIIFIMSRRKLPPLIILKDQAKQRYEKLEKYNVLSQEEFNVNGYKGSLLKTEDKSKEAYLYLLHIGDETESIEITLIFTSKSNKSTIKKVLEAFKNIKIHSL